MERLPRNILYIFICADAVTGDDEIQRNSSRRKEAMSLLKPSWALKIETDRKAINLVCIYKCHWPVFFQSCLHLNTYLNTRKELQLNFRGNINASLQLSR